MARKFFPSRRLALLVGYGGVTLGAWALYEAYELSGRKRPFMTKFLPGG
jgi:hypothetical protein